METKNGESTTGTLLGVLDKLRNRLPHPGIVDCHLETDFVSDEEFLETDFGSEWVDGALQECWVG
jgi:hypothetical protein